MFPLVLATLLLAACGGFDDGDKTPEPGSPVTVRGTLLGPDGVAAMADATVYNKPGSVSASLLVPQADEGICSTPWKAFEAYTCTDSDGSFILETTYAGASTTLVARKGAWTVELDIDISNTEMDVGTIQFSADPRAHGARIAVVNGAHDDTGAVLDKLGRSDAYDMFSGSSFAPDTFVLLFDDLDGDGRADIYNYDLVFFDCGMDVFEAVSGDRAAILRAFVEAGGSVYATDWSYHIVERAFPEFIDFRGDDTDPNSVLTGPVIDQLDAVVLDDALASWLDDSMCGTGGCLNADGTLRLLSFESIWAVMDGVEATAAGASVKALVEGNISVGGAEPDTVPLAVTFDVGAGRVVFTSFHSHSGDEGSAFLGQERLLEYLIARP